MKMYLAGRSATNFYKVRVTETKNIYLYIYCGFYVEARIEPAHIISVHPNLHDLWPMLFDKIYELITVQTLQIFEKAT